MNPSQEANSSSVSHKIHRILRNSNVHYHDNISSPLASVISKRIRSTPSHSIWFGSSVITVDPSFVCCYNSPEEVLVACALKSAWHINTRRCCCSSVNNRRTKPTEICLVFKYSLRIPQHVPYQTHNPPTVSKLVLSNFDGDFTNFLRVFISATCSRTTRMLTTFNRSFPTSDPSKTLESLSFTRHCRRKLF